MPSFEISASRCACQPDWKKDKPKGVKKEDCLGPYVLPNGLKVWEYQEDVCPHETAYWAFSEDDFDKDNK